MNLHINQLTKQFPQNNGPPVTVLDQIELQMKEGEFVSLLGPSGCGKSTLLSLIAGLKQPTSGTMWLGDKQIIKPSPDKGVVFQEAALFPWLNVQDNVIFPLRKTMNKKQRNERANFFLQKVQLGKYVHHYPHELSGGMQQRVAIARVLAMNPKLLLMDEPFGALDEQTRNVLQRELETIWIEANKTIVFVTHSIREAVKLSDRVILMGARPGRIIADFKVNLERPRKQADMAPLEEKVMSLLKAEIDKVMKEELSYANSH
ncbi:MAG TPA: ABC transporter ATP-binding protein [Pseudogracilibacillus sp.]|nr:ABC transporter ATP-binding protein [Pseudogracilibacillus sp.]